MRTISEQKILHSPQIAHGPGDDTPEESVAVKAIVIEEENPIVATEVDEQNQVAQPEEPVLAKQYLKKQFRGNSIKQWSQSLEGHPV